MRGLSCFFFGVLVIVARASFPCRFEGKRKLFRYQISGAHHHTSAALDMLSNRCVRHLLQAFGRIVTSRGSGNWVGK